MDEQTELKPPSEPPRPQGSRFTPGAMLAGRFRIVALLGKGGMGEVYRAEDVKLGQQVALKFLPDADAAKLERLYREVRLGRQVSHPNVCRIYDVLEGEGQHFISMEYIDGEDLASLLRRIGKLPHNKALDIARDLCAGLASAHALGIIHRDLKPANVMIDGRGRARITDFGLAGLAEEMRGGEISGTPAYMAPEQISGGEVSARTDLYALGLILTEVFTGKKSLSSGDDIDPAIQRVIARCLERRPEARPASIHSVIASLPGGDPLQAAIDAGETPSPEMVAAAGETGELPPARGWAMLAAVILLTLIGAAISQRTMLYGRVNFPKKPDVLAERARDILASAGYTQSPVGMKFTFGWNNDFFERGPKNQDLNRVIPSPVVFYYRESPRELLALGQERRVTAIDPPLTESHMANVELDAAGHLIRFVVVPPQLEEPPTHTKSVDWSPFIALTGVDATKLRPAAPKWRAPVDSDAKFGWEGGGLRIEAASQHGRPVWFSVIPPWQEADRLTFVGGLAFSRVGFIIGFVIGAISLLGALFLSRRNLRGSRGDRKGAARIAMVMIVLTLATRLLRVDHVSTLDDETMILGQIIAMSLLFGGVAAVMYLAVEPYFRRRWPNLLIGWTRLLAGRGHDPMVGRDILVGAVAGTFCGIVSKLPYFDVPFRTSFTGLSATRHFVYLILYALQIAFGTALLTAVLFLVLRIVSRSTLAATILLVLAEIGLMSQIGTTPREIAASLLIAIVLVTLFRRYGLLALVSMMMFLNFGTLVPATLDTSTWYFERLLTGLLIAIAIAAYAFKISLASQPAFGFALLEEE